MRWSDAPLQVVLDHYAELTGRTLIQSPGVPAVLLSLRSQDKLTETEFLVAIESTLAMNNVALVPLGDKFLKVIPSGEIRTHGEEIHLDFPNEEIADTDQILSRIFELQYIGLEEIQPLLESLRHAYAKIQPMQRANALMITDTAANLNRIAEVIAFLDRPITTKVETRVYAIQNAAAADIAGRLGELIETSRDQQQQQQQRRQSVAASGRATTGSRGVVRAGSTAARAAAQSAPNATPSPFGQSAADLAERGIIQGTVKIVADERTNILIIISDPENFTFFDRIVTILDKAIEPEIAVEVVALEYAEAEQVAGILNEFVGAATQDADDSDTPAQSAVTDRAADARSTALRDFIAQRQAAASAAAARRTAAPQTAEQTEGNIGRLSSTTRILADDRTNSLLLMGRRSDIDALKRVIDDLDVMLAQVLIEAVIIEIVLDENTEMGVDWLQRSYIAYNEENLGPGGGLSVRNPVVGFGGGQNFQDAVDVMDGGLVTRDTPLGPGALTYFATFYDLNLDAVIRFAASSDDAKILQTPVIVTTDNTEATIIVGESRPVVTSTSVTAGGVGRNTFQYQDIGIQLDVTPRINPARFVVMEITQTADNVGGFEIIDGNRVPVITRREMQAEIAVENRSSIVLGGLIGTEERKSRTKIPILGDIPILGSLFRTDVTDEKRTELLVIITPYVMTTPEEVLAETQRLNDRSLASSKEWSKVWSDSPLIPPEERAPIEDPALMLDDEGPGTLDGLGEAKGFFSRTKGDQTKEPSPEVDNAPQGIFSDWGKADGMEAEAAQVETLIIGSDEQTDTLPDPPVQDPAATQTPEPTEPSPAADEPEPADPPLDAPSETQSVPPETQSVPRGIFAPDAAPPPVEDLLGGDLSGAVAPLNEYLGR